MNFFLDHDVPADVGRVLHLKGHPIRLLEEALPNTTDDLLVMRYAASRGMVVITCNRRDFLRLAENELHAGIIILVRRRTRPAECAALLRLLEKAASPIMSTSLECCGKPILTGPTAGGLAFRYPLGANWTS